MLPKVTFDECKECTLTLCVTAYVYIPSYGMDCKCLYKSMSCQACHKILSNVR